MLVVLNFTPVPRHDFHVAVPWGGDWQEMLNSDAEDYGGSGLGNFGGVHSEYLPWKGKAQSLALTLPPLATVFFEHKK